jgi:hypothetical protein
MTPDEESAAASSLVNTRQFLLRSILRRYSAGVSPPRKDLAQQAWREESVPALLRIACDAWDIPLGELARSAGLEQTVLAQFVMGTRQMTTREQKAVVLEMDVMIGRREHG